MRPSLVFPSSIIAALVVGFLEAPAHADYLVETSFNKGIAVVSPDGTVSTFVSKAPNSQTNYQGVAFSSSGILYVADYSTNSIERFSITGADLGTMNITGTTLSGPTDITFDSAGNLYVLSQGTNTVEKISTSGVSTVFATAGMNGASGMAFDGSGNLYVSNFNSNSITKYSSSGTLLSTIAPTGTAALSGPDGLVIDGSGNIYVANSKSNTIDKIAANGSTSQIFVPTVGATTNPLDFPSAMAVDSTGAVYVANSQGQQILKLAPDGSATTYASDALLGYAQYMTFTTQAIVSPQYWNGSVTTADNILHGGNGTWNTTTKNWTNTDGSAATQAWLGDQAFFGGTAGTVTLGSNVGFGSIEFQTDGYVINADAGNNFSLTPSAISTITTDSGVTATINAPLTGIGSMTKAGTGTLVVSGANTYSGATMVTAGTLVAGAANTLPSATIASVSSGATLDLNSFSQSVGSIVGAGTINLGSATLTTGNDNSSTIFSGAIKDGGMSSGTGGSLVKVGGGMLTLSGSSSYTGTTSVNGGTLFVTGSLGNTAVTVANTATIGGTGSIGGSLTINSGGILAPGTTAGTIGTLTVGGLNLSTGSIVNYDFGTPGNSDLTAITGNFQFGNITLNINALGALNTGTYELFSFGGTLTPGSISIGKIPAGFTLSDFTIQDIAGQVDLVVTGGVSVQYWDGNGAINDGTVAGGSGTWNGTSKNWTNFSGSVNSTWGGGIADFAAPGGTVAVSGTNNFQGLVFDTTGYVLSGGTLNATGSPFIKVTNASDIATVNSKITGSAGLTINGPGTLVLGAASTYTGGTTIAGGTLRLGVTNALPTTGALTINAADGSTTGLLDLHGFNQTVAGLTIVAPVTSSSTAVSGTGTLTLTGGLNVVNNATGSGGQSVIAAASLDLGNAVRTITVAGQGQAGIPDLVISSVIKDGGVNIVANPNSGNSVPGLVRFSGINTYTGATTVSTGVLQAGSNQAFGVGSAVTVNSGATLDLNGFNETIGSLSGAAGSLVNNGSSSSSVLTVGNTTSTTFGGVLENTGVGSLSLVKAGTGTLTLTGANTYVGTTVINAGTLQIGNGIVAGASIASSPVQVNATGTLAVNLAGSSTFTNGVSLNATTAALTLLAPANNTLTVSGLINGTGVVNANGPGIVQLTNTDTYTGATKVNAGTLMVGDGTNGNLTATSSVTVANNATLLLDLADGSTFSRNVALSGTNAVLSAEQSGTTTLSGVISGTGTLLQNLGGTTILTNTETYTGATAVSDGILQIGTAGVAGKLAATSIVRIYSQGEVELVNVAGNAFTNSVTNSAFGIGTLVANSANTLTISGALTDGAGVLAFTQSGSGTTILANAGDTYSGPTTITNGTLQLGSTSVAAKLAMGTTVNIGSGATFSIVNVSGGVFAGNITNNLGGTGLVSINAATPVTLSGTIADGSNAIALTKAGTGAAIITGADTYTGTTTVNAGTLQIGNGTTTGTSIVSSGTVQVNAGGTLAVDLSTNTTFANAVSLNAATASLSAVEAGVNTLSGVISGSGGLNQTGAGTTILTGIDTYTGLTKITAGTLQLGDGTNGSLTGTSGFSVSGTGSLAIDLADGSTFSNNIVLSAATTSFKGQENSGVNNTVGGIISGTGSFNQTGAGTTTITGNQTYTGATNVTNGKLTVNGSLASGSTVNVGTAGTLAGSGTINGKATITGTGTINLDSTGIIGGTLTATGGTWAGGGTVKGAVTSSSGVFTITSTANLTAPLGFSLTGGTLAGSGTLTGSLNDTSTGSSTFGGVIAGPTSLVTMNKAGGTLLLTGTNTYGGATNVMAGTLQLGDGITTGSSLGAGNLTVSGTGTLAIDLPDTASFSRNVSLTAATATLKTIEAVNTTNTISGFLTGTGGFNQAGLGTAVLSGTQTYTGATTVTSGTLDLTGSLAAGSTVNVLTGGTLTGNGHIAGKATLAGNGTIDLTSGGSITGTLGVTGGNWGGVGTVGGAVTETSGLFTIGHNATLTAGAGVNVTGGTLAGPGTIAGNLNYASASSSTFNGVVSGATSTVTMNHASSTLALTGINTYVGATTVTAGTLQLGDGTATGATLGSGPITVAAAGTLATDLANTESFAQSVTDTGHFLATGNTSGTANNYSVTGVISGTGNFTKSGNNTVNVTGTNTYKGGTVINAGTLLVNNTSGSGTGTGAVAVNTGATLGGGGTAGGAVTLNKGGAIDPGFGLASAGTALKAASLLWNGGSTITLQLGASNADELMLSGALTKGTAGAFNIDLIDAGIAQTSYTLMTFASTNFLASTFTLELPSGYTGSLVENSTSLVVNLTKVTGESIPNTDEGAVIALNTSNEPTTANLLVGDGSLHTSMMTTSALTPTPEPGSALLLGMGGAALLGWRRRRRA